MLPQKLLLHIGVLPLALRRRALEAARATVARNHMCEREFGRQCLWRRNHLLKCSEILLEESRLIPGLGRALTERDASAAMPPTHTPVVARAVHAGTFQIAPLREVRFAAFCHRGPKLNVKLCQ